MNPSRDPFGFTSQTRPQSPQGRNPLVVVAQPGQEIRVVIADDGTGGGGSQGSGDSGPRGSSSGSGDSGPRGSSSGSGDSGPRGSSSGSGDSGPRGSSSGGGDAFGFQPLPRGFSPAPITVIAHAGQEIRIVVPDGTGSSGG